MLPQFLLNRIDPLHSFNYCFKKMQTARAAGWGGLHVITGEKCIFATAARFPRTQIYQLI